MKKLLLCLALPAALIMSSCSKDNATKTSMVGNWVGTYSTVNEDVDGLYENFILKADSTMQVQTQGANGNTYYGSGTWSLSGTNFTTTYTENNSPATFTGTLNTSLMQITGTWVSASHLASGSFSVTQVP